MKMQHAIVVLTVYDQHRHGHSCTWSTALPWVGFAIVSTFGFANVGVDMSGIAMSAVLGPPPLGIAAGLSWIKGSLARFKTAWPQSRPTDTGWPGH